MTKADLIDEVSRLSNLTKKETELIVNTVFVREVALFVAEKLAPLEQVQSTATSFVLKSYKVEGQLIKAADEDHRLVVAP